MKQILVYYILAGDDFDSTKDSVKLDENDCQNLGILKQIFFPVHDTNRERIESIHIENDR